MASTVSMTQPRYNTFTAIVMMIAAIVTYIGVSMSYTVGIVAPWCGQCKALGR